MGDDRQETGDLVVRWLPLVCAIAVCGSTLATSLDAGYVWDDRIFLNQSPGLEDPSNLTAVFSTDYWGFARGPQSNTLETRYYRPLPLALLIVERTLFGPSPFGYRVVHALIHLINVILLFLVLQRISRDRGSPTPALGAAILCVAPYSLDTVMFLTGVCDLLATAFVLMTTLFFLSWVQGGRRLALAGVVLGGAAAVLSKESTLLLPIFLGAIAIWDHLGTVRARATGLTFSLLGVTAAGVARFVAIGLASSVSITETILRVPADIGLALRWTVLPYPLVLEDRVWRGWGNLEWWISLGVIALLIAGALVSLRRKSVSGAGILGWFVFVVPSSLAVTLTGAFAPRYLYLPTVGTALLVSSLIAGKGRALHTVVGLVLILLALGSMIRVADWEDSVSLWSIEAERNPDSSSASINLGNALEESGDANGALALWLRGARLAEEQGFGCEASGAYYNAAVVVRDGKGDRAMALNLFDRSIRRCPHKAIAAWLAVAVMHGDDGDLDRAMEAAGRALEIDKNNPDALSILGGIAVRRDDREGAERFYRMALEASTDESAKIWLRGRIAELGVVQK